MYFKVHLQVHDGISKSTVPFYEVRSDILADAMHYGGTSETSTRMPVVDLGVVNKSFPRADYFSLSGDSSMEFIFKNVMLLIQSKLASWIIKVDRRYSMRPVRSAATHDRSCIDDHE